MRKILLSIILMSAALLSGGQVYHPFPDSCAVWREHYRDQYYNHTHYQFGIVGDTVIDLIIWHKLYADVDCLIDSAVIPCNDNLVGAIREDSLKRVFFYNIAYGGFYTDSVYKLYDFSAEVGDTIWYDHGYSFIAPYIVVDTIDSVWVYDRYRKRFHVQWDEHWIEGIGSLRSLLSPVQDYPTCDCVWDNVCFKHCDTTLYLNPPWLDCYDLLYNVPEDATNASIKIYPVPADHEITLEIAGLQEPVTIRVYDLCCREVIFCECNIKSTIPTKDLDDGAYTLIASNGDLVFNRKIIILHTSR